MWDIEFEWCLVLIIYLIYVSWSIGISGETKISWLVLIRLISNYFPLILDESVEFRQKLGKIAISDWEFLNNLNPNQSEIAIPVSYQFVEWWWNSVITACAIIGNVFKNSNKKIKWLVCNYNCKIIICCNIS